MKAEIKEEVLRLAATQTNFKKLTLYTSHGPVKITERTWKSYRREFLKSRITKLIYEIASRQLEIKLLEKEVRELG